MKIAIIGAGFCGLSSAYLLLHQNKIEVSVTLFDDRGIGGGASGKASGLMHPYAGKRANFSYKAEEAFPDAQSLIEKMHIYSIELSEKPVVLQRGILRPATHKKQFDDFHIRSEEGYPIPLFTLSEEESSLLYDNPCQLSSLYIPSGVAIDSFQYLKLLYQASWQKGLQFTRKRIESIESLEEHFDHIIVTAGYETKSLLPHDIITNSVKGQRIVLKLPQNFQSPKYALSGTSYAVFSPDKIVCLGSTYEHHYIDEKPDEEYAKKEIFSKIALFWPELTQHPIDSTAAGIRATTATSHPLFFLNIQISGQ